MMLLLLFSFMLIGSIDMSAQQLVTIGVITDESQELLIQKIMNWTIDRFKTSHFNITSPVVTFLPVNYTTSIMEDICRELPMHSLLDLSSNAQIQCQSAGLAEYLGIPYTAAFLPYATVPACHIAFRNSYYRYDRYSFTRAMEFLFAHQNITKDSYLVLYDERTWDINSLIGDKGIETVTYFTKITDDDVNSHKILLQTVAKQVQSGIVIVAADDQIASNIFYWASEYSLITPYRTWFHFSSDLHIFEHFQYNTTETIYRLEIEIQDVYTYEDMISYVKDESLENAGTIKLFIVSIYDALLGLLTHIEAAKTDITDFNATFYNPSIECKPSTSIKNKTAHQYFQEIRNAKTYNYSSILTSTLFSNDEWIKPNLTIRFRACLQSDCNLMKLAYRTSEDRLVDGLISNGTASFELPDSNSRTLRVIAISDPPFVFIENGKYYGYSIDVLNHITKRLNYKYVIVPPQDEKYGIKLDNGTWNGIIGELASRKADVAVGPISVTSEREVVVDFTIPYYDYGGLQILMKKQIQIDDGSGMFFFVTVFSGWVWLSVGATLIVTAILVTAFDKLSPYSYQNRKDELADGDPEGKVFTIKESMWFVLGAYTQAGESFDPRATSTRLLVAGFWIFACIMMALYTANLAAFLTVSKLATSIKTVSQLAAQTDIKYTVQRDTIGYTFFERMQFIESKFYELWRELSITNELASDKVSQYSVWEYPIEERYTDMYQRMTMWGFVNSTEEAMLKIRQGWAVFLETPIIKYYLGKDCDLTSTGEILSSRPYGILLQDNSPLTADFNMVILEMQRDRILENYKVHWWEREKVKCPVIDTNNGIKLETLGGVFIFLAGGIGVGFIILLIEIAVAKIFGTERFKTDSFMLTHLAPKPMSIIRRRSTIQGHNNHTGGQAQSQDFNHLSPGVVNNAYESLDTETQTPEGIVLDSDTTLHIHAF